MNDDQIYTEWELSLLIAESREFKSTLLELLLELGKPVDPDYNLDPETMTFAPAQVAERDKANVESLKRWGGA